MTLFSEKNIAFGLASVGIIVVASYFSNFVKDKLKSNDDEIIRKYLLNESPLYGYNKPKLWVHSTYEYNSRKWESYGSRSSTDLNQPYLHLTIKSLIHHCGDNFHVCLIDDDSFQQLIPGWTLEIKKLAEPFRAHYRQMAMINLLYIYGGMIVPNSFVCIKNLAPLYGKCLEESKPFVCEIPNKYPNIISSTKWRDFTSSSCFMGAMKRDPVIKKYLDYLKLENESPHFSSESEVFGYCTKWLNINVYQNKIILLDGLQIGTKNRKGHRIMIEDLMEEKDLELCPQTTFGVLIPRDDILKRTKYQWFAVMSLQELLQTNLSITKYMLLSLKQGKKKVTKPIYKSNTFI